MTSLEFSTAFDSAESAGDVVFGVLLFRMSEDPLGFVELDQFADIHESRVVGAAGRLLHVVSDDRYAVVGFQLGNQLLNALGRERVQRRSGLVEQQDLRLDRDRAGNAQSLLLTAREAKPALPQLVPYFVPECRPAQRRFNPVV